MIEILPNNSIIEYIFNNTVYVITKRRIQKYIKENATGTADKEIEEDAAPLC